MSRYRLARQAIEDLDEIVESISSEDPEAANRVLDSLHKTFQVLARNPRLGRLRDDLRPNLRVFPAKAPAN